MSGRTVGIVGLGLIGGSMAKAYKRAGDRVLGIDKDMITCDYAALAGAVDGTLTDDTIEECDVLFIAITPAAAIDWLKAHAHLLAGCGLVIDCCGNKRAICETGFALAAEHGFTFLGGHPMAGRQFGGFKNSEEGLFDGALFALVPEDPNEIFLLAKAESLLKDAGFTRFSVMTAEQHDRIIAFTSQMAHLVSNAYVKSDTAMMIDGARVSGGAFRDMTRVAFLDERMWTALFLENRDNLLTELDDLLEELLRYQKALQEEDREALMELLREGKERKLEVEKHVLK